MKKLFLIIFLILLLAGCARELQTYELPTAPAETGKSAETKPAQEREWEIFNTYPVGLDVDALLGHTDHEIVFLQGKYAQYYDAELRRGFAFCSQPNCPHSDESCPSYIGGDPVNETTYVVTGDSIYAVCLENPRIIRLRQLKPLTGEKTNLYSDTLPEAVYNTDEDGTPRNVQSYFQNTQLLFTGSALILQYQIVRQEDRYENDRTQTVSSGEQVILRYDLNTGRMKELLRGEIPIIGSMQFSSDCILDASDRYALFVPRDTFAEMPLTEEEFLQNGGDQAAYEEYLIGLTAAEKPGGVLLWDLETDEKTVLCDGLNWAGMAGDYAFDRRHHTFCFLKNDRELWRLDLSDGTQRKLLDVDESICNLAQWDGRVFFAYSRTLEDGTKWYDWYWYELATGALRQYQRGENYCVFSIWGETDHYFIGSGKNGFSAVLSKQDFYNENYEDAKSVGFMNLVN